MIVGTAGHIDHGKTTLVQALTGVNTDRLPEERARGISIELGYAYLNVPAHSPDLTPADGPMRIGFVDVPGHERLVHTMLAGATGIDLALLLVAADDGVMPQTREHTAILALLGVTRMAVVITKSDRVLPSKIAEVDAEIDQLLAATPFAAAPHFVTAATRGDGVTELRDWLFAQSLASTKRGVAGQAFRLAVDRAFTLDGVGTVVTGSVHAGRVRVGEDVQLVPGARGEQVSRPLRIRSLHAQNATAQQADPGQRAAIALAALARDEVARGQWLVSDSSGSVSTRIDVDLTVWQGEAAALRSGTRVHVHLGAASLMGSLVVLNEGQDQIDPGGRAWAQLTLSGPVGVWRGDRVILRDASATRTIAGGRVLDPNGPARHRRTTRRLAELQALAEPVLEARWNGLLALAEHGVSIDVFRRAEGLQRTWRPPSADTLLTSGNEAFALSMHAANAALDAILSALGSYHLSHPDEFGLDRGRLRRMAVPRMPAPLFNALIERAMDGAAPRLRQRGASLHLPEHALQLSSADERIAQSIAAPLAEARFEGAWVLDLARRTQISESLLRTTVVRLAQMGSVHQVVRDLVYSETTVRELAMIVRDIAARHEGELTAAQFRDATRLGRKRAIQILEYFDRIGLCRRIADRHRVRSDCTLFLE